MSHPPKSRSSSSRSPGSLWRHANFRKLWAAQTISQIGSQVTFLALPLVAITTLQATPFQMGLLSATGAIPFLLLALVAGVWVDRLSKRPLLIIADIGRAFLLLLIPVGIFFGVLHMTHLYAIAFVTGALSLLFGVAYRSYLPALVDRAQLVEGNSKLEISRSAAEVAGPGLAGLLIQWLTASIALVADAFSFLLSALFLGTIRQVERPVDQPEFRSLWREAREGLTVVFADPLLRPLAGCLGTLGFFNSVLEAVALLYLSRNLELSPGLIGLIFAGGNLGFIVGALLPEWLALRIGMGKSMMVAVVVFGVGDLIIPFAGGPPMVLVILLATAQFFFGVGFTIFNVQQVSLRQALTPDHLQGRMNATLDMILQGSTPVGALIGGVLGATIGLRATLVLAAVGELLALGWLWLTPLGNQRAIPDGAGDASADAVGASHFQG